MSEIAEKINRWSRKKWLIAVLIIFTLQMAFFILLSERNQKAEYGGKILMAMMSGDSPNLPDEIAEIQNPIILAFPTKNNYSSKSWFRIPPLNNDYYEWIPDNYLLSPLPELLGNEFSKFLPNLRSILDVSIFEIKDELAGNVYPDFRLEDLYTNSVFRIEGEITRRGLIYAPSLPVIESSDVLPPSTVEIVVNEDGYVVSSTLIVASGSPTADQKAVELSKKFIFSRSEKTDNPSGLSFGKITFYWLFKPPQQIEKK